MLRRHWPGAKKEARGAGTFGAVAAAFMHDHAKDLRRREEYQRKIDVDLADWHDCQIADIKRADIKDLIRVKVRTAPVAANRLLSVISKIFNWAVDEDIIDTSPAMRLKRPARRPNASGVCRQKRLRLCVGCSMGSGTRRGRYTRCCWSGQRRGEVAGMRWSEINEEGWKLPGERAKKGKGYLVPLSLLAREILDGVPRIGELVFRANIDTPLQGFDKVTARVKKFISTMKHWYIHDLRRTFATHLRSLGVERLVVSKLLNHAEAGVTKIYDRYAADPEKSAAMERWANRLQEIISGAPASNVVQMTPRSA